MQSPAYLETSSSAARRAADESAGGAALSLVIRPAGGA